MLNEAELEQVINRFSLETLFGWIAFTKNLQPFIKYTQPDGTVVDESSHVLQAVVRFRIKLDANRRQAVWPLR